MAVLRPALAALLVVVAGTSVGCASVRSSTSPGVSTGTGGGAPRWHVVLQDGGDVDVGVVATRLCFDGPPPSRVGPEYGPAVRFLSDLPRPTDVTGRVIGPALPVIDDGRRSGIDTSSLPPGSCVAFDVDVEAAAKAIDQRDLAEVIGRSLLVSPDVWLWRPKPWPGGNLTGHLVVDDADRIAVPFGRDGDGAFVVPASTFALQSYSALGTFASRVSVNRRGATFDLVRIGDDGHKGGGVEDSTLLAWLDVAVDDVAVPLLRFPVPRATLFVVPAPGTRPVLAGFLGRGGGPSALFIVGRGPIAVEDDPEILDEDGRWVLTHELAHALLPPVIRSDAWFNEGLTTWHQEVLPAAAGRRTRDAAEAQLRVGLRTGARRSHQDGLSLERSCREMDARGSYQHCYWGGAALMVLLARDVGDDGVFALVRAIHALGPVDAAPQSATSLLERAAQTAREPQARVAAEALLSLWRRHRDGLFPAVDVPATDGVPVWPGET
jgi:hypothetical protein